MNYNPPSPEQIRALLKELNLTQAQAAKVAGLSSGASVRKYLGGAEPRKMSYAVLFTLVAKSVLDNAQMNEIEQQIMDITKP